MSIHPPFAADQGSAPFLFVSYAHKDKAHVYPLINQLHEAGIPIWYDEGIPPSTKWLETIASKIKTCACFLVFLSQNAVQSENVLNEVLYALKRYHKKEIKFIPIYLEPTDLPDELDLSISRIQALLRFDMPPESFYQKLFPQISYLKSKIVKAKEVNVPILPKIELKSELGILSDLEKLIGKSIPPVNKINPFTLAVKVDGDQIVKLSLYNCQLRTLPESFGELKSLQNLELSYNQLTALPASFGELKSLQTLKLGGNQLTALPESFGQLKYLQTLELSYNQLTALPASFGELKSLQTLYLSGNKLTTLPEPILQLKSLQILSLGYNQITTLPTSFGQLKSLIILYIGSAKLTTFPESILQLKFLHTLDLGNNQLRTLPESFGQLKSLDELFLNHNQLTILPESFLNLTALKTLYIMGNPLDSRAKEILKRLQEKGVQINPLQEKGMQINQKL